MIYISRITSVCYVFKSSELWNKSRWKSSQVTFI